MSCLERYLGNLVALAADEDAVGGLGNAYALEVEVLDGGVLVLYDDGLNASAVLLEEDREVVFGRSLGNGDVGVPGALVPSGR